MLWIPGSLNTTKRPLLHFTCIFRFVLKNASIVISSGSTRQDDSRMKNCVKALKHQLDGSRSAGLLSATKTVYMWVAELLKLGQDAVDLAQHASAIVNPIEFSIEANPDSLSDDLLASLTAGRGNSTFGSSALTIMNLRSWAEFTRPTWLDERVLAAKSMVTMCRLILCVQFLSKQRVLGSFRSRFICLA